MNRYMVTSIMIAMLAVVGCSKTPRLDASSMKTLKDSSDALRKTLSVEDLALYDASVTSIIVSKVDPMTTLQVATDQGLLPTQESVFLQIKPAFDKKSFSDIIKDGKAAEKGVQAQLARWKSEKEKLTAAQRAYNESSSIATKFSPVAANLRLSKGGIPIFGDNPVEVDVTFKNNTGAPVESVVFDLALMPPTVTTPWVMQPVNRKFDAPVPAGGEVKVTAGPINVMIPDSYKGEVKLEADIQVTAVQIQGKPAVKVARWDEANLMTLTKLDASITGIEQALQVVRAGK